MIDFNFLENNLEVEDFEDVVSVFCNDMRIACLSLLHDYNRQKSLLPPDEPHNRDIRDYFLNQVKEIVTVRGHVSFYFNNNKFRRFWQTGTPVPMFESDEDRESIELMLYDIVEGRVEVSTAREILDNLRVQRALATAK